MSEMPRPDLCFSKSQKGGKILHHRHHGYYKCKVYGDGSILWKCRSYFKDRCPAYIVTLDNVIKRNQGTFHNHGYYKAYKSSDLVGDEETEGNDSASDDDDNDKLDKVKSLLKRALQELKAIQEEEEEDDDDEEQEEDEEEEEQEQEEDENSTDNDEDTK